MVLPINDGTLSNSNASTPVLVHGFRDSRCSRDTLISLVQQGPLTSPALFQPITVGELTLQHRVVLAPLTRFRAYATHVPGPQAATYYAQRASTPGTLLITEATFISQEAGGYQHIPGIYTDEQIEGWKEITDAVHAKGSFIYLQLWALGRAADESALATENNAPYVSASPIRLTGRATTPRALMLREIKEYVQAYATAAKTAVNAGFDGVEIHGANGYLIDQFLQDVSDTRTDEYGGSVENRARFALEVVKAVVEAVGPKKTGIRLSPWSPFQDMGMKDPIPTFTYLVSSLLQYPLAYIHVIEPGIGGNLDHDVPGGQSNDFIRQIWRKAASTSAYIAVGGYSRATALQAAEEKGGLVAFGRLYMSNPDLPRRFLKDLPLTPGDRSTNYRMGDLTPLGYSDWPFAEEDGEKL
ncbi:FMN-linked oxidoreductase [Leucogyrophana mollusca]|uniref:FMN-linked oxidoreductase n=1 Tax=Leucogyrophana mollusca TaxID=85980 RepID=A0ACB8BFY8_9AGAM|nr:FMN-linked oxidoreductase [Leucogyrophana mollusca]